MTAQEIKELVDLAYDAGVNDALDSCSLIEELYEDDLEKKRLNYLDSVYKIIDKVN